jgi:pantothenate kinase
MLWCLCAAGEKHACTSHLQTSHSCACTQTTKPQNNNPPGVSIIRVDGPGEGQFTRVSGSSVGGGTFWGLCRLLTGRRDFDDMLSLSMQGNNANVSV